MAGNYQLLEHFQYADDSLIMCEQVVTDINLVLQVFNQIRPELKFNSELKN